MQVRKGLKCAGQKRVNGFNVQVRKGLNVQVRKGLMDLNVQVRKGLMCGVEVKGLIN